MEFAVVTGGALGEDPAVRRHRFLAVLAITGGLWAPRDAAAFCDLSGPYLGTGPKLPLGCPLHVYSLPRFDAPSPPMPMITVIRGGSYVDATGAVTRTDVQLRVARTFLDCRLQPTNTMQSNETYQRYNIVPKDVQVGELIGFGSGWFGGIEILPAGTCPAPIDPQPACTEPPPFCGGPQPIDDIGQDGCAAAGGGGLALGLLLLGLCAPRRRRR
jgi:hypothetical protein